MMSSHEDLDSVWRALANPHRRRLLDLLRARPCTTGELAAGLGENRFLVMQHLNLLREANLVTVEVDGRRRINHLNPVPIQQIYERWVGKYQGDWASALVGLKRSVEAGAESRAGQRNESRRKPRHG
jgi:DNA-binding transcriptional ArsR family regulator